MAIGTASIVYVIAEAGTGKSFSGDYLAVVHGIKHVDGDSPLKNVHLPKNREIVKSLFKAGMIFEKTGEFKEELWGPHCDEWARLTLEAAKDHDRVVFTHATGTNMERDHYIKKLVEGGVPRENITLVQLTIDLDVKYRGLYYRTLIQFGVDSGGMTMEDVCKSWGWEFEGGMTADKFVECSKKFPSYFKDSEKYFEDRADAVKVDVSGRDITHCDNLDAALGLTRSSDWTYQGICDEVKPVDEQRDRDMVANGMHDILPEIAAELEKELNPVVEAKQDVAEIDTKEMKKRRSSLLKADLVNGRQFSSFRIADDKTSARRSTLILHGKIDLDLEE
ncbi:hypothetical protein ACHAWF_005610 [Thalassiosira exigua]